MLNAAAKKKGKIGQKARFAKTLKGFKKSWRKKYQVGKKEKD
jgi:hypothetical protein